MTDSPIQCIGRSRSPHTLLHSSSTISSRKYAPPFCTLLLDKSGEGVFARIISSSRAYAPPSIPRSVEYSRQIRQSLLPRLSERMAALLNVYYGKSVALALVLSQEVPKQLASSVVMRATPRKFMLPVRATKNLAVARKWGGCIFACVCLRN